MMDAKARLVDVLSVAMLTPHPQKCGVLADAVLAEFDLTPKPPQPAGPVTLTFVVGDLYQGLCEPWDTRLVALGFARGQQVRVTIEDAAAPSALLTPAEVERRAREWGRQTKFFISESVVDDLVAALTRGN